MKHPIHLLILPLMLLIACEFNKTTPTEPLPLPPATWTCGDGHCETALGESSLVCPSDCPIVASCGNNECETGENSMNCPGDCSSDDEPRCGDLTCNREIGETFDTCETDCPRVVLSIVGICRVSGTQQITCEDASTSRPTGHIAGVNFLLRQSNGAGAGTGQVVGGCATAPAAPCEVLFTGLATDVYSVEHVVTPDDSGPVATRTYPNLSVAGPSSP